MSRKIKASESQFSYKFRNLFSKYLALTQTYLADLCGVTRQTVGFWCNGKSVPDAARMIAYNAKFAEYINILSDSDKFIELLK